MLPSAQHDKLVRRLDNGAYTARMGTRSWFDGDKLLLGEGRRAAG